MKIFDGQVEVLLASQLQMFVNAIEKPSYRQSLPLVSLHYSVDGHGHSRHVIKLPLQYDLF